MSRIAPALSVKTSVSSPEPPVTRKRKIAAFRNGEGVVCGLASAVRKTGGLPV